MIPVVSIGGRAADALAACSRGRVLACFRVAYHLLTDDGALVIITVPEAGAAPLNLVAQSEALPTVALGAPFSLAGGILALGPEPFDLSAALPWDARPDWAALAACLPRARPAMEEIQQALKQRQPVQPESRLQPVRRQSLHPAPAEASAPNPDPGPADMGLAFATATAAVVLAYGRGDRDGLEGALRALCGLGPGLTPAGDDWLAGWLLGLHLAAPGDAGRYGRIVMDTACTRTTLLSRSYLACAAAGEVDTTWRRLLAQLTAVPADINSLVLTTRKVLARGATSGAAMLAGFIAALVPVSEVQPCPP